MVEVGVEVMVEFEVGIVLIITIKCRAIVRPIACESLIYRKSDRSAHADHDLPRICKSKS